MTPRTAHHDGRSPRRRKGDLPREAWTTQLTGSIPRLTTRLRGDIVRITTHMDTRARAYHHKQQLIKFYLDPHIPRTTRKRLEHLDAMIRDHAPPHQFYEGLFKLGNHLRVINQRTILLTQRLLDEVSPLYEKSGPRGKNYYESALFDVNEIQRRAYNEIRFASTIIQNALDRQQLIKDGKSVPAKQFEKDKKNIEKIIQQWFTDNRANE